MHAENALRTQRNRRSADGDSWTRAKNKKKGKTIMTEEARYNEHFSCINNAVEAIQENDTASARKYAERAKELFPDDFDTLRVRALVNHGQDDVSLCLAYEEAVSAADNSIREKPETYSTIHDWYRSLSGRPYIRLLHAYANSLVTCGRMKDAVAKYETIISLTHYDGYGDRYRLMGLYALFENAEKAKKLLKKYKGCEGEGLFLHAALCFFKKGDYETAKEYLLEAYSYNKNIPKLFAKCHNRNFFDKMEEIYAECCRTSYMMHSYEECVVHVMENIYAYNTAKPFFEWAVQILQRTGL